MRTLAFFLILILLATSCSRWSPRVNTYGLPQREYTYQQPEVIDDGWGTSSLNAAEIDSEKIDEMMLDILGPLFGTKSNSYRKTRLNFLEIQKISGRSRLTLLQILLR